jgi:hypothetical protein
MTVREIEDGVETAQARRRRYKQKLVFLASVMLFAVIAFQIESRESLKDAVVDSWNSSSHAVASWWQGIHKDSNR